MNTSSRKFVGLQRAHLSEPEAHRPQRPARSRRPDSGRWRRHGSGRTGPGSKRAGRVPYLWTATTLKTPRHQASGCEKKTSSTSIHIENTTWRFARLAGAKNSLATSPTSASAPLAQLDENGVVRSASRGPGDTLVGKVAPKEQERADPEEKLLHAIFGRAGEDVKNDSLEMPAAKKRGSSVLRASAFACTYG